MGIVAFITMGVVMLFLPLGIVKGLVQKFLLTEDSAFYTISVNVILHAVGISLICFGGYYCSQENLIQYSFAITTNFLFIFLIGSFLWFFCTLCKKWEWNIRNPCAVKSQSGIIGRDAPFYSV